jgi:hypothetical protein
MSDIIRCPYCVLGFEFRPMIAHVDGGYICNRCGTLHVQGMGFMSVNANDV